jgi:excisionase family DNA binding protein
MANVIRTGGIDMKITSQKSNNPGWDIQLNSGGRAATLTISETAKLLGISKELAYDLAQIGELPGCLRLEKRYLVWSEGFKRWLEG